MYHISIKLLNRKDEAFASKEGHLALWGILESCGQTIWWEVGHGKTEIVTLEADWDDP